MLKLFKDYDQMSIFEAQLGGFHEAIFVHDYLLHHYMPKLYDKMTKELEFTAQFYTPKWYIALFLDYFPQEIFSRIMDVYLNEGQKTIFRIGLAILKVNESKLMKANDLADCFAIINQFPKIANID